MQNYNNRLLIGYGLVSPLHLANFMSYYYSQHHNYDEIIICIVNYWNNNIIPARYIKFLESFGIKFIYKDSIVEVKPFIKQRRHVDLILVNEIRWRTILPIRNNINKIIIIDEGLSSYRSYRSRASDNENIKLPILYLGRSLSKSITSLFRIEVERFKMFDLSNYTINIKYQQGLFKYFQNLKDYYTHTHEQTYKNTILFCSQMVEAKNESSIALYLEFLLNLKKTVERNGYHLLIKKHPAENIIDYESFGLMTLKDNRMVEEIFFTAEFKAIISKNSTSSFLIPALYNVHSYLLDLPSTSTLGKHAYRLFNKYCIDFSYFMNK